MISQGFTPGLNYYQLGCSNTGCLLDTMLGQLVDSVTVIRTLVATRVGEFVRRELGEFRSDPRWLLQGECEVGSTVSSSARLARTTGDHQGLGDASDKTEDSSGGGVGRSHDLYGGASGGGHGCCPPVVDQYTWLALITGIALATYFLRVAVTTNIMGRRRRRRREGGHNILLLGW